MPVDLAEAAHRYLTLLDLWGTKDSPEEWASYVTNYDLDKTFAKAARGVVETALEGGTK